LGGSEGRKEGRKEGRNEAMNKKPFMLRTYKEPQKESIKDKHLNLK
jgi:hypothetical protein